MSNWDLMMPGMGLTAIGLAGVIISYAGIAHTFIDGMHALTGLTMFIGLIFLSAGILEGGVSTSNRAKATTLVILSISLAFGLYGFTLTEISTIPVFAGLLLIIVTPAVVIAYVAMKMPEYLKPISAIFILAAGAGIASFIAFGVQGPDPFLLGQDKTGEEISEEAAMEATSPMPADAPIFSISILAGSSEQGNPDYDPDMASVQQGHVIEWTNNDEVAHTVTSSLDFGETFDSSLLNADEKFQLDSSNLALGEYEYLCIVHPWMIATIVIEEPQEPVTTTLSIPQGAGIQQIGQLYYDPQDIRVTVGTTVVWENNDSTIHTVTSGTPEEGPSGLFDSELIVAGGSFEYTFDHSNADQTVDYFCIVHPWMIGSVTTE